MAHPELRVIRAKGITRFDVTAEEIDSMLADYVLFHTNLLLRRLNTAKVRLELCAGRMEACNMAMKDSNVTPRHELVEEVWDWIKEMKEHEKP